MPVFLIHYNLIQFTPSYSELTHVSCETCADTLDVLKLT